MDAGVTTLNIQAPTAEAPTKFANDRIPHNHKPNFGRYVTGCLACQAKHPDGPPKRAPKAKAPAVPTLTREDVIALLREHAPQAVQAAESAPAEQTTEPGTLEKLVQLMLNRESRTLQKEDADEKRKLQAREDMVKVAKEQEAMTKNIQDNCGWEYGRPGSHTKENGRTAVNGQIHNDGLYHPICFHCFKAWPPVKPSSEQLRSGVVAG
jgi:hypothetical protein